VFVAASAEWDDRPGAVRDAIVETQRRWLETLARAAGIAVAEGHFRKDLDLEQFAFELHGIMLELHFQFRLLDSSLATRRARDAFERLLSTSRASSGASTKPRR
jgi:hypothetical protein